jgi:WD40 repeat protein
VSGSLLESRGVSFALDAYVVSAAFDRGNQSVAWGLGDGSLRIALLSAPRELAVHPVHDGGLLSLAADARPGGFISGGDDGRFLRVGERGEATELASFGSKWVEQVASFADAKTGILACAAGKVLRLFDLTGEVLKACEHPSTVTGIAFDAKGKRVAASHYNGATLWFVASKSDTGRHLEWKGSHIGVALHPGAEAVVTAMQENALHGWRLPDAHDMRMSGYPSKTESLSFTQNGRWLATSGADAIVIWPFFGGGPMGKPPVELAQIEGVLVTRVACHPTEDIVAAGYADGSVVIAEVGTRKLLRACPPEHGPVTALAWSFDGAWLAYGTETGFAAVMDLGRKA